VNELKDNTAFWVVAQFSLVFTSASEEAAAPIFRVERRCGLMLRSNQLEWSKVS
jgi:hypothetical protein